MLVTVALARPDAARDLLLAQPELVDQLAVRVGFLDRVQVGALDVLDDRQLELVPVGKLADDGRDPLQPSQSRGTHASLAGDEDVPLEGLRDDHRLEHAVLADARGEIRQLLLVDVAAGLIGVRCDPAERDLVRAGRLRGTGRDQG